MSNQPSKPHKPRTLKTRRLPPMTSIPLFNSSTYEKVKDKNLPVNPPRTPNGATTTHPPATKINPVAPTTSTHAGVSRGACSSTQSNRALSPPTHIQNKPSGALQPHNPLNNGADRIDLSLDNSQLAQVGNTDSRGLERWNSVRTHAKRTALIVVMGATGVGKSSFLAACGGTGFKSGHTLHSETREPTEWSGQYKDWYLTLVDTPGFGDTTYPDTDILRSIATWLSDIYRRGIGISGIIYVHRITDNRMTGTAIKNIQMFEELCGMRGMANTVLCTSFWDAIDESVGDQREKELMDQFWKDMLYYGAVTARHNNSPESARNILDMIIDRPKTSLRIQAELEEMPLQETSAGRVVQTEIEKLEADYIKQMQELVQFAEEAKQEQDQQMLAIIQTDRERMEDQIIRLQQERLQLTAGLNAASHPRRVDRTGYRTQSTPSMTDPRRPSSPAGGIPKAGEMAMDMANKLLKRVGLQLNKANKKTS